MELTTEQQRISIMSHTPAPWEVIHISEKATNKNFILANVGSYCVVSSSSDYGNGSRKNAQLMAAAPELLEALKKVSALIHQTYGVYGSNSGQITGWESLDIDEIIHSAILKAESQPEHISQSNGEG